MIKPMLTVIDHLCLATPSTFGVSRGNQDELFGERYGNGVLSDAWPDKTGQWVRVEIPGGTPLE